MQIPQPTNVAGECCVVIAAQWALAPKISRTEVHASSAEAEYRDQTDAFSFCGPGAATDHDSCAGDHEPNAECQADKGCPRRHRKAGYGVDKTSKDEDDAQSSSEAIDPVQVLCM